MIKMLYRSFNNINHISLNINTMPLYFITGNRNKFREAQKIIPSLRQLNIDLPEIQEIDPQKIIEAKLKEAFQHKKGRFIVEDTSLYLDCLNDLPGPLIKWFLQSLGNQGLFELADKFKNYQATAKTVIGYAKNSQEIYYFEGVLKGTIIAPQGKSGFGWDPIFQPQGYQKSLAKLSLDEKNAISMRRQALNRLQEFLRK